MGLLARLGVPLLLLGSFAFAQNDLPPEVRADVERRVHLQRSWDSRQNSPGAELRATELLRKKDEDGYIVRYEFNTKGLPSGLGFDFLIMPTMASRPEELQSTGEVLVDEKDGRLIDGPDDPRSVVLPHPAPGEPYRFVLVSKNGKYKALLTLLPNPIQAADNSCKVSVVRLMPHFELAFVQATGFPPDSEVPVRGNSEGEIHDFKLKINADGYSDAGVLPFKLGKKKGKMEMHFTAATCAPKVSFKWGATDDGRPYQ